LKVRRVCAPTKQDQRINSADFRFSSVAPPQVQRDRGRLQEAAGLPGVGGCGQSNRIAKSHRQSAITDKTSKFFLTAIFGRITVPHKIPHFQPFVFFFILSHVLKSFSFCILTPLPRPLCPLSRPLPHQMSDPEGNQSTTTAFLHPTHSGLVVAKSECGGVAQDQTWIQWAPPLFSYFYGFFNPLASH